MKRVARRQIALITIDPLVAARMWLLAEYIPEVARRDAVEFPSMADLSAWLGRSTRISTIPVPHDSTDGVLLSFWSRPEGVLNPEARAATSGFARLDASIEAAAVQRLADDLASGAWDRAHGMLRHLDAYDAGLRLVVAEL